MNITFLIGNGFDIKLGLKNRYVDFYKSYVAHARKDEPLVVKTFKKEINGFIMDETHKEGRDIDWRDLEVALGKYTSKVALEEFDVLYFDVIENLKSYLKGESEYFDPRYFVQADFLRYLNDPVTDEFNHEQERALIKFMRSLSDDDVVDIINFNYTSTTEQLSGFRGKEMPIGKSVSGRASRLRSIRHIHQSLTDEDILVGVNDRSQISNQGYVKNVDVCDLLIKPNTNAVLGTGVNTACEAVIANTNLFVLFGTSAGITDRKWWKLICDRLLNASNYVRMLFFVYLPDTIAHQRVKYGRLSRSDIRRFVQNAGMQDDISNRLQQLIFVSYSEDMFKMPQVINPLNIPEEFSHSIAGINTKVTLLESTMRYVIARVEAPTENYGVDLERAWINAVLPGYSMNMQSLLDINVKGAKIPFDRLSVSNGVNKKDIYFDISSFYGNQVSTKTIDVKKGLLDIFRQRY